MSDGWWNHEQNTSNSNNNWCENKGGQMRSKKLSKYAKSICLKQFYKIASFDIWSGMGKRPPVAKHGYGQGACPPVA